MHLSSVSLVDVGVTLELEIHFAGSCIDKRLSLLLMCCSVSSCLVEITNHVA